MADDWITKGVLVWAAAVMLGGPWPLGARAAEYGYQSDVAHRATVASARRILTENGGLFIGPEAIRRLFNTTPRLPYRTPFSERDLIDCGPCVLFPAVSRIGYRGRQTSINGLWRAPEAKHLFRRGQSRLAPWFQGEPWARKPLGDGWHLVRLAIEDRGRPLRFQAFYRGRERPPAPNTAFWLLLLLPPERFAGEYFFTSARTHRGRDVVILGRPHPGAIDISYTPRELGRPDTGRLVEILPRRTGGR